MSDPTLHELSTAAGISASWTDHHGHERCVADAVLVEMLRALGFASATPSQRRAALQRLCQASAAPPPLMTAVVGEPIHLGQPLHGRYRIRLEHGGQIEARTLGDAVLPAINEPGYHEVEPESGQSFCLAVAPRRCFGIADLAVEGGWCARSGTGRRRWGVSAQVYSLSRAGDGGIGDLGGVAALARCMARQGADALAMSPIHALMTGRPQSIAPYAPSSRLMRNPLVADPSASFSEAEIRAAVTACGLGERMAQLERQQEIDPDGSATAKRRLFRALFGRLNANGLRPGFEEWCRQQGDALRDHAAFEVLRQHFLGLPTPIPCWRDWPAAYRDHRSEAVRAFVEAQAQAVELQMFEQWLTARSLLAAQRSARYAGMAIGLVSDLAVGIDPNGSEAWSRPQDMLSGLSVGAPPDMFQDQGQNWGLTTFSPLALVRNAYRPFIDMLRANMRDLGGIRLDHVFALQRLWWIPQGRPADQGAYLSYPLTDLLRLVALESWRHRCIVIGEDLGTMPDDFHQRLMTAGVLGTRVLWFQRDEDGAYVSPASWPSQAVAMTTTHDLPTVSGWWQARDLDWQLRLGRLGFGADERLARRQRQGEREGLWSAFVQARIASGEAPGADAAPSVASLAAEFIGRTPCELAILPFEDVLAISEQPNIPGTQDEHPNWRRRLPGTLAQTVAEPEARTRLMAVARGRAGG